MITLTVTFVVVWTIIRILQFLGDLWRAANGPRIGVVTPA
jgi:hypothetical protein